MRMKGHYSGLLRGNGERLLAAGESVRIQFPVQMDRVRKKHFACKTEALERELNQIRQEVIREGKSDDKHLKRQIGLLEQELERLKARTIKV